MPSKIAVLISMSRGRDRSGGAGSRAQQLGAPAASAKPAKKIKKAKPKAVAAMPKAAATPSAAPPCARGQWKDDPVCFGENDPRALPTPNARSGAREAAHVGDITSAPKAGVNDRSPQDPIPFEGNNPNPKPSGSDFGGGVGMKFPF